MKRIKDPEKELQAEIENQLDHLLHNVKRKKSALKKFQKIIPEKNEKEKVVKKSNG